MSCKNTPIDRPLSEFEARLVEKNLLLAKRLASRTASRFCHTSLRFEDFEQEAYLELCRAAQAWERKEGTRFSTYAYSRIWGSLRHYARDAMRRPPPTLTATIWDLELVFSDSGVLIDVWRGSQNPIKITERASDARLVRKLMSLHLSPTAREALTQQLTRDVGDRVYSRCRGLSKKAVWSTIERAMNRLRSEKQKSERRCENNLRQYLLDAGIWANKNGGKNRERTGTKRGATASRTNRGERIVFQVG